jgi:hypothetical protein
VDISVLIIVKEAVKWHYFDFQLKAEEATQKEKQNLHRTE